MTGSCIHDDGVRHSLVLSERFIIPIGGNAANRNVDSLDQLATGLPRNPSSSPCRDLSAAEGVAAHVVVIGDGSAAGSSKESAILIKFNRDDPKHCIKVAQKAKGAVSQVVCVGRP